MSHSNLYEFVYALKLLAADAKWYSRHDVVGEKETYDSNVISTCAALRVAIRCVAWWVKVGLLAGTSWLAATRHASHCAKQRRHILTAKATSAVRVFNAALRAAHSSSDCWRPSVHCCRSDALEQSATRRYWLCVTDVILPKTKNFFVFCIIPMTTFFFLVVFEAFT